MLLQQYLGGFDGTGLVHTLLCVNSFLCLHMGIFTYFVIFGFLNDNEIIIN